jgi:hypothetical protein
MTTSKKIIAVLMTAVTLGTTAMQAQNNKAVFEAFNHLDVGVTLGSTGLGIDIASPFGKYVQVRTGFEIMPRFEKSLHFDIQSFGYDENGQIQYSQFDKMADRLEALTNYRARPSVEMIGKPTLWNFKLMVDVFPFRNKHWHLTAGFHWGPSKIAEAINALDDAPSLVAVNIYNKLYEKAESGEVIYKGFSLGGEWLENGRMGIHLGDYKDRYMTKTVVDYDEYGDFIGNHEEYILDENGNKIHEPYRMEPDNNCTVSAKVKVNSFKPYLGFGYGGRLLKNDDRYNISFDAGLMFWGGTPDIITHDGTNLSKDVINIGGKVGDYVDLIKGVKAFPVLNLRITRRLF